MLGSAEQKLRGQQLDFAAGGSASFIRLRPTTEYPGATIEAWDQEQAQHQNPGEPLNPRWTGVVGRAQLVELAVTALKFIGYHHLVDLLLALETARGMGDDYHAVKQFRRDFNLPLRVRRITR